MRRIIITTGPWAGDQLAAKRMAAGLSQAALARLVAAERGCEKTAPAHVQRWERGTVPNATALAALARVLRVTMDELCARRW